MTDEAIRVAVRIRPQIPRELIDMCRVCTEVTPNEPQILLGSDKVFTFDHVFDMSGNQVTIYSTCVDKLVEGALNGYNATILAYGQTGSGKTYTMGTGFERDIDEGQQGIIPRAVRHIFSGIEELQQHPYDENGQYLGALQFSVAAQFMELYNEDIIDLLDPYNKGKLYKIHEDSNGSITVSGATIKPLNGPQDAINVLQQGALARTTASTNMNEQSSRSHALFTILIRRQRVMTIEECGSPEGDLETLTSKFHFVDLAGSERLKRTGATGERAREGISINCGLLALGNVISALGDKSKKVSHVPYRDSKLTRLLQDSLGGNSQTVMIACVSPSDRDFMETLNTLKYANRARNIKNKVQINQDQSSRTISQLRREIANLQLEILEYKQGKRSIDAEGNSEINDTFLENSMLIADNKRLQQRLKAMQETINALTDKNAELQAQKVLSNWSETNDKTLEEVVERYIGEIEKLKAKLIESEQMFQQLKKTNFNVIKGNYSFIGDTTENVINMAKKELEKERELLMSQSLPGLENDSGSDSETSESDSEDKADELQNQINDISSDIEIKSKLIEQLEMSQKRMEVMKQQYEEKLNVLNAKILNTQKERDLVISNMTTSITTSPPSSDKIKKVKEEYERKLTEMQSELKKLQKAQKEHIRQQRELHAQDAQLKKLRTELTELKQIKIRLMKKITEENNRHKEMENQKTREIAILRKEARKQVNMIRSLQAQGAAKDQVLKRKTEEVSNLRKNQRSMMSVKAAGRTTNKIIHNKHPRHLKQKWDNLQRTITRAATSKQAVMELERELERLLDERNRLGKMLNDIKRRQSYGKTQIERHVFANEQQTYTDLLSEEDSIKSNIQYVQYNIKEIQDSIIEIEEGKDTNIEKQLLQAAIEGIATIEESKYLLEKLCNTSIVELCETAITQARLKEKDQILYEVQQDNRIQEQLLQHIISKTPAVTPGYDLMQDFESDKTTDCDTNSIQTINPVKSSRSSSPSLLQSSISKTPRMSRKTIQTTEDLLYGGKENDMSTSFNQEDFIPSCREMIPLSRVPSAPGSLKGLQPSVPQIMRQSSSLSPYVTRKNVESITYLSPRLSKKQFSVKNSSFPDDETSPSSPPVFRRSVSKEDKTNDSDNRLASLDVFSRLGAGTQDPSPGGKIKEFNGKLKTGSPLICTHIVDGHNNSVLSIKATKDTLFTASADRTVKVWNLQSGVSSHCLSSHLGPVVALEYDPMSNILFSASGAFIKMWDLREHSKKAVKTLCSSGSTLPGSASLSDLVPGECSITALVMGSSGKLYTAASEKVRVWDMRMLSTIAKLSGNHQAAVMCLTTWKGYNNVDYVATGSKDHYVKVFEVPNSTSGAVYAIHNLEPPHYDGVQALTVTQGDDRIELFSGSRDSGIKEWDLQKGELKQSLNNAHNNKWISGMAYTKNILFSTCRGGLIRLWNNSKTCEPIADMKTETSINDIFINDGNIYTASNDGKVTIWKLSSSIRKLSNGS